MKMKMKISGIVTTPGNQNPRNGLDHIKTKASPPLTGMKLDTVRISNILTTITGIENFISFPELTMPPKVRR